MAELLDGQPVVDRLVALNSREAVARGERGDLGDPLPLGLLNCIPVLLLLLFLGPLLRGQLFCGLLRHELNLLGHVGRYFGGLAAGRFILHILCTTPHADGGIRRDGNHAHLIGSPAIDPVDWRLLLEREVLQLVAHLLGFELCRILVDGIPDGDVPADAVGHVPEDFLAKRRSREPNRRTTHLVRVAPAILDHADLLVGAVIEENRPAIPESA